MREERVEVLTLISEGKVSVEEGAELLEALEEHYQRRQRKEGRGRPPGVGEGPPPSGMLGSLGRDLREILQALKSSFGDAVHSSMHEAFNSSVHFDTAAGFQGYQPLEAEGDCLPLAADEGLHLHLKERGELQLVPGEPGQVRWVAGRGSLLRRDNQLYLSFGRGAAEVELPPELSSLEVWSAKGGIYGQLPATGNLQLRTMKGDIRVLNVHTPFRIKSMKGDLLLDQVHAAAGRGDATTMKGDIKVWLESDADATITTFTMAGRLRLDPRLGEAELRHLLGYRRGRVQVGDGQCELFLRTMAGNVSVQGG